VLSAIQSNVAQSRWFLAVDVHGDECLLLWYVIFAMNLRRRMETDDANKKAESSDECQNDVKSPALNRRDELVKSCDHFVSIRTNLCTTDGEEIQNGSITHQTRKCPEFVAGSFSLHVSKTDLSLTTSPGIIFISSSFNRLTVVVIATMMHTSFIVSLLLVWASAVSASTEPISFKSGIAKVLERRLEDASGLAKLEQSIEDWNAQWVATADTQALACSRRRLICLPLDERFDPPMGVFSHGHVQTGDKMSVPRVFWEAIETSKAEVPWLMQVSRVEGISDDRVEQIGDAAPLALEKVVGGPLDFRAPANYCFLPWWQMRALGLQPRDVVDMKLITTVPPGSAAQLRPHSSKFAKEIANTQAVLETELKHYSSLTKGSVIAFDYNGKRYWFDVVELRSAPRGEKCDFIKVQDCDIATDFLPAKDTLKDKKKNKTK
jgi:hypothetical protein